MGSLGQERKQALKDNTMLHTGCKVQVGVRLRPFSHNEVAADSRAVVNHPNRNSISVGDGSGDKNFTFDHVFPSSMSQAGEKYIAKLLRKIVTSTQLIVATRIFCRALQFNGTPNDSIIFRRLQCYRKTRISLSFPAPSCF